MEKKYAIIGAILMFLNITGMNFPLTAKAAETSTKPPTTTSWYVKVTADESEQDLNKWMYSAGFDAGREDASTEGAQDSLVVLDFGQPWEMDGVYGVWSFGGAQGRFLSTDAILASAKQFALGYYNGTGRDVYSSLKLVLGTNNYGEKITKEHGEAWAKMVKEFGSWLKNNKIGTQVVARAGNDMEPDFGTPSETKNWMKGYESAWSAPYYVYNYGAATACSAKASSSPDCLNGWTQSDIQYLSWGAEPAWAIPEIYADTGVNAKQWHQISLKSHESGNGKINYLGVMSQRQACNQRGGCDGINNGAHSAWDQMASTLNSDERTAQQMSYSTDIKWRK